MTRDAGLIVLSYTRFGERSVVLHALSREWGRSGFIVKIGRSSEMAHFLPLSILEASVTENPKSTLMRAGRISTALPLSGIRGNMYKNAMTMFMSEVLYRVVKDGTNEDGLYDWVLRSILTLDSLESDFSNYHIRFLLELAVTLGFSPAGEDMRPFAGEHLPQIMEMMSLPLAESMLLPLRGADRTEMCAAILKYIEYHTESAVNVKSLDVLRELFAGA